MEISIKWNICRVCLQHTQKTTEGADSGNIDQMRHLFNEDKKLALHIYELSGVFMKPGDSLPDKICCKCVSIINNAIHFRKTCRSSNAYLRSILKRTKSASNLFKPEILKCHVSEDEADDGKMETDILAEIENGFEHANLEKEKDSVSENHDGSKEDLDNMENISNSENQEKKDEGLTVNIQGNPVELEEMIEISEDMEDQMFTETIEYETGDESPNTQYIKEDNTEVSFINIKYVKPETSHLQKYYMNTNFSKLKNFEDDVYNSNNDCDVVENVNTDIDNLKVNNEELYHFFKDVKNDNSNSYDNNKHLAELEDQHSVTDTDLEYVATEEDEKVEADIDESLVLHLDNNENQDQVSSTVETNDIERDQQNSNISNITNDLDEECLVNENFGNCDISSSKSFAEETNEANSHKIKETKSAHFPTEKKNTVYILPRRKIKRFFFKPSEYVASRRKIGPQVKVCVCEICGNQFTNRNLMNIHMKVHFQQKNHQCELCFKRFITACNLQAHMRIHTGEKPFECKYCDRRFNDRSSNLRHERTHTNEKPFECVNCGKSFSLATTLQNHMKVHTNERSYRCEPCGKSFKLPHHLKTHQNTSLHRSVVQIEADKN